MNPKPIVDVARRTRPGTGHAERYTRRVPVSPAWMELMWMTLGTEALVSFRSRSAKSSPDLRGTQNSARPFLLAFAGGGGYLAVNSHAEVRSRACRRR